jgi:hypothetical protein
VPLDPAGNGPHHTVLREWLEQILHDARLQTVHGRNRVQRRGKHDGRGRKPLAKLRREPQPAMTGHLHITHDDVCRRVGHCFERRLRVGSLANVVTFGG